jgi:hypothetical protein
MATQSFHEGMEIRDDEAAKRLLRIVKDKGSQKPIEERDISAEFERGLPFFRKRYYL